MTDRLRDQRNPTEKALGLLLELATLQSQRLDGMDSRLDGIESRLDRMEESQQEILESVRMILNGR
jgi:hypothetical protein